MWISLIIFVLTYLLQNPKNSEERKKALIGAAAAGAITYGVTEYTDWGQENLAPLNDSISDFVTGGKSPSTSVGTTVGSGTKAPTTSGSGTSSIWDTLTSWGPAGTAAVVGVGAGTLTGNNKLLLLGGAALVVLFLLK